MAAKDRVVLFDGVCNLCNSSVQLMIDHNPSKSLSFAPIQSDIAEELLVASLGAERTKELRAGANGNGEPDSIIYVEGNEASTHSTAALRIAGQLSFPYSWLRIGWIMPRFLRDWIYRFIARHRYRWFGKSDTCRVPTPELRARFLA